MTLTQKAKMEAKKASFAVVGISNPEMLHDLPYGKIDYVGVLRRPEERLNLTVSKVNLGLPEISPDNGHLMSDFVLSLRRDGSNTFIKMDRTVFYRERKEQ